MLNGKPLVCISSDLCRYEEDPRRMINQIHDTYTGAIYHAGGIPMVTCNYCHETGK